MGLAVLWTGDDADGQDVVATMRDLKPELDLVGPMPYAAFQQMIDDGYAQIKLYGDAPESKGTETFVMKSAIAVGRRGLGNIDGSESIDAWKTEEGSDFSVSDKIETEGTQVDSFHFSEMNRVLIHQALYRAGYGGHKVNLLAGLPVSVAGNTVNRLCASGLQAIMDSARTIACGDAQLMIAAGVESMTRAPFVVAKSNTAFDRSPQMYDTTMGWRFINKALSEMYYPYTMGETAENVARQWNISREAQDEFALASQEKYFAAKVAKKWDDEIVPVELQQNGLISWMMDDEHPRETSLDKLAKLKPAFAKEGSVTAGNSAGINDGAAAMLLASEAAVKK